MNATESTRCVAPRGVSPRTRRSRSSLFGLAAAGWVSVCTLAGSVAAAPPRVGPIAITVSDADVAAEFFERVLDFERLETLEIAGPSIEQLSGVFAARQRIVRLRLGREEIELIDYLAPESLPYPEGTSGNDQWFQHMAIVVSDMQRAYARLREHRVVHASSGPQRLPDWNRAAGGIEAFYFRDPDGHFLELIHFPPDKGDPRWQQGDRLFMGIDHTAITVSDTAASLAFYRDELGLRVTGTSENHGPEQEHLNGVFGARLRITALRGEGGPGIELLEYLTPRTGRPRPRSARASDLLSWHTQLATSGLDSLEARLTDRSATFDSPGIVVLDDTALGVRRAMTVADPDGHRLRIAEGESR